MPTCRIALANLRYPASPDESVTLAERAIAAASAAGAELICFPEAYVPGYRGLGHAPPPPDPAFLERAWATIAGAAKTARVAAILGTERVVDRTALPFGSAAGRGQAPTVGGALLISALVIDRDGAILGFQDKVQLDPPEEGIYAPAPPGRRVFATGSLTFGIAICHEGWRYPETVRWPARHGAQIVFHPHLHEAEPGGYVPSSFGDPANTFHEKAVLCRAAENTCYFASVNYASARSPTTSAVARPDGTLLCYQPYGIEGLLMADLDLAAATRQLASRLR